MFIPLDLLRQKAEEREIILDETALDRFDLYGRLLVEWNEKINLTAITEPEEIALKHFLDCLMLFKAAPIEKGAKIIDVGTGAGFPGLVMLIARPELKMTLLDSTNKRLNVIRDMLLKLELEAEIVHARAEEAGRQKQFRESFDYATARAVTNLRDLSEYCLPFVKVGGSFLAMKGARAQQEIDEAQRAIRLLGGKISSVSDFNLDNTGERSIVIIKKLSSTSAVYPRASAKIAKNPII